MSLLSFHSIAATEITFYFRSHCKILCRMAIEAFNTLCILPIPDSFFEVIEKNIYLFWKKSVLHHRSFSKFIFLWIKSYLKNVYINIIITLWIFLAIFILKLMNSQQNQQIGKFCRRIISYQCFFYAVQTISVFK